MLKFAVAFGGLGPELSGDLNDRLRPRPIDFHLVKARARTLQSLHVVLTEQLAIKLAGQFGFALDTWKLGQKPGQSAVGSVDRSPLENLAHFFYALFQNAIGIPFVHFVGAHLVGNVVDLITDTKSVQQAQEEIPDSARARLPIPIEKVHPFVRTAGP